MTPRVRIAAALLSLVSLACTGKDTASDEHVHDSAAGSTAPDSAAVTAASDHSIPPDAAGAQARLAASPRHGEWVMIPTGGQDSVKAWVVYPERSTKAPVVVVVHEIFGLSTWVRSVADQLAADGFIAIAPDLLTGKVVPEGGPDSVSADAAVAAIRTLDPEQIQRQLSAAAAYGMKLPAALPKYGIVGFCWGGGVSFAHAVAAPSLGASVVYYGTSPKAEELAKVRAPVLGLYGENDARVTATVAPADSALRKLGRTYEHVVFPGAGHGFLRAQSGQNGANGKAAEQAWPRTVDWFKKYLGA